MYHHWKLTILPQIFPLASSFVLMKWAGIVVIKHIHTEYKLYSTHNNMEHTSEIITCLNTIWRSFPIEIRFDKNLAIDINLHVNKIGIQKN